MARLRAPLKRFARLVRRPGRAGPGRRCWAPSTRSCGGSCAARYWARSTRAVRADRRAPRGARPGRARRRPLDAAARARRGRRADDRRRAARRARDAARRRPRDDGDRAGLGVRAPRRATPAALERLRGPTAAYVDAVVKETLRLRPVVLIVLRKLLRAARGRRPRASRRADARAEHLPRPPPRGRLPRARGVPARALPRAAARHYTWIPFGGGVRRCIGAAFAQVEMEIVLHAIAEQRRTWRPSATPSAVRRASSPSPRRAASAGARARGSLACADSRPPPSTLNRPRLGAPHLFLQRDQPPGVPPLALTGERTLPDVPEENYWFRRHLVVYEWIRARVGGLRVVDLACGEGYGSDVLARSALSVVGVDANPDALRARPARYRAPNVRFERNMIETYSEPCDAVVFLQTIEHVQDPDGVLEHVRGHAAGRRRGVRLDAERAHAGAGGRRALGQPVARARVPRRGVPRAVRRALRRGRAARPVPRADAARPPGRDRAPRVGRVHAALRLTKPFYDRFTPAISTRDFALRAERDLDRALDFLAVCARERGPPRLVLHTHMPYVEGFGTWPFGEEWLWEAIATSYLPLLDLLDAGRAGDALADARCCATSSRRPARSSAAARSCATCARPRTRLDIDGGRRAARARRARARGRRVRRRARAAARTTCWPPLAPHAAWTSSATHAILPLLATDAGVRLQVRTGRRVAPRALRRRLARRLLAARVRARAVARRAASRRPACTRRASTSPTSSGPATRATCAAAQRGRAAARARSTAR